VTEIGGKRRSGAPQARPELNISLEKVCFVIAKARELRGFLADQNDDELKELLALTWLGRGDFTVEEWRSGLRRVRDVRQYHTADYLLGTPLLTDFLEEGLAQFGLSCVEVELGRM
jgi:hypothetical protein